METLLTGRNPADIGSTGVFSSKLKDDELWWKGSPWLWEERSSWPTSQVISCTPESQEEIKKTAAMINLDTQGPPAIAKVVDVDRQGRLRKLLPGRSASFNI